MLVIATDLHHSESQAYQRVGFYTTFTNIYLDVQRVLETQK